MSVEPSPDATGGAAGADIAAGQEGKDADSPGLQSLADPTVFALAEAHENESTCASGVPAAALVPPSAPLPEAEQTTTSATSADSPEEKTELVFESDRFPAEADISMTTDMSLSLALSSQTTDPPQYQANGGGGGGGSRSFAAARAPRSEGSSPVLTPPSPPHYS
ncbi:unnamed protein product, partial [Scytosiphon promiscuus]